MTDELSLEPLEDAIKQLDAGLKKMEQDPNDDLRRDGVIQRFEYTMDLAWKALQRYLKTVAQVEESALKTKKDIFRESAKRKLIHDAEAWIGHYEARNETSHTYNAITAQNVFERAKKFLPDVIFMVEALRNAN